MNEKIGKRQRAANYSNKEIHVLMNGIKSEIHVIENKKTDAVTMTDKQKAWERVTSFFNMNSESSRDVNSLKLKYENIKKNLKKKISANKQNYRATGGGPSTITSLKWYEEFLFTLLQIGIAGLSSQGDCDQEDHKHLASSSNMREEYAEVTVLEVQEQDSLIDDQCEEVTTEKSVVEHSPQGTLNGNLKYSRSNTSQILLELQHANSDSANKSHCGETVELVEDNVFSKDGNKSALTASKKETPKISSLNSQSKLWKLNKRKRSGVTQEDKKNNMESFTTLAGRKTDVARCQEECYKIELELKKDEKLRSEKKWALEENILQMELQMKIERHSHMLEERNHKEKMMEMQEEEQKLKIYLLKHDLHKKIGEFQHLL